MSIKGSVERRAFCINIAARMLQATHKEAPVPTALELVQYARVLDRYVYEGKLDEAAEA